MYVSLITKFRNCLNKTTKIPRTVMKVAFYLQKVSLFLLWFQKSLGIKFLVNWFLIKKVQYLMKEWI